MGLWQFVLSLPLSALLFYQTSNPTHRSYTSLQPRTRLLFGAGIIAWASLGLYFQPSIERGLGMTPTEQETEDAKRLVGVRLEPVDRKKIKNG